MTQALDLNVFCNKAPMVFDWTVLIENQSLNFAELNSLNCHSKVWTLSQGKPLIYNQIENLIKCGFKKFLIALFHIDNVVKQQISQLQSLHQDCTFKCLQVNDSWFFEDGVSLTKQGEKYLQHYMNIFLNHSTTPIKPSFVWVQKIEANYFNPLDYLKVDPHHSCPLIWINKPVAQLKSSEKPTSVMHDFENQKFPSPNFEKLGFWLDIKGFAYRYKAIMESDLRPRSGSITKYCFEHTSQHCEEILLKKNNHISEDIFSHEDSLVASRCFNQVSIDTQMGVVVKQSTEIKKLQQEIDFYQALPSHLQIYFPRLLDSGRGVGTFNNKQQDTGWYSLEYYPYKSLSQYFVYYALPMESWQLVFDRLLNIHSQFVKPVQNINAVPNKTINGQALYDFYAKKLDQRIQQAEQNLQLNTILNAPSVRLNGKSLKGFKTLQQWLDKKLAKISEDVSSGFVHGDMCFSNILFEPTSGVIRLIDPRGDFMGSVNQGDPRYDLAKIMHSVHGKYDFIINDLFILEQDQLTFNFSIPQSEYLENLEHMLLEKIQHQTSYKLNDLILLESLLFMTMLPLHHDQPKRQIAFLLTGLKLLNQVYEQEAGLDAAIEASFSTLTSSTKSLTTHSAVAI